MPATGSTVRGVKMRIVETQHIEGVLHLATAFEATNLTLCKRRVVKRTLIPVDAFGNKYGAKWCRQCRSFCHDYGLGAGRVNLASPVESPVDGYRQYRRKGVE